VGNIMYSFRNHLWDFKPLMAAYKDTYIHYATMDEVHSLLKEITNVTLEIETDFPELYRFLDEDPMTIPIDRHPQIDKKVLQDYLQSLKHLLKHHIQTHQSFNQ